MKTIWLQHLKVGIFKRMWLLLDFHHQRKLQIGSNSLLSSDSLLQHQNRTQYNNHRRRSFFTILSEIHERTLRTRCTINKYTRTRKGTPQYVYHTDSKKCVQIATPEMGQIVKPDGNTYEYILVSENHENNHINNNSTSLHRIGTSSKSQH